MKVLQTAERVSHEDKSDNYVFQRSLLAYLEAAKMVSGDVLEIGTGEGYGIKHVAPQTKTYLTLDKRPVDIDPQYTNVSFRQMVVPPLKDIADESFDFVVSFQVIEHIEDDKQYVSEIHRVLRDYLQGRTAFIVTHRLAILELAERIVVMDRGRIASTGTYEELQKTCPVFQRLIQSQTKVAA